MKIVYFAWLRERVGKPEEEREIPAQVHTIAELISYLQEQGEEYAYAFEKPSLIRAAINRKHVKPDALIVGAAEVAFFPPVTGG
jgi:sulfur-carrier protein